MQVCFVLFGYFFKSKSHIIKLQALLISQRIPKQFANLFTTSLKAFSFVFLSAIAFIKKLNILLNIRSLTSLILCASFSPRTLFIYALISSFRSIVPLCLGQKYCLSMQL